MFHAPLGVWFLSTRGDDPGRTARVACNRAGGLQLGFPLRAEAGPGTGLGLHRALVGGPFLLCFDHAGVIDPVESCQAEGRYGGGECEQGAKPDRAALIRVRLMGCTS